MRIAGADDRMEIKGRYKTKQLNELQEFLRGTGGAHFTAQDVLKYFQDKDLSIGKTTVYRRLEELVAEGSIKKYFIEEGSGACFEYIGGETHPMHYHLKCERCGKLFHLDCDEITCFEQHISEHHKFRIDPVRTVFYGICEACGKAEDGRDQQ